MMSQRETKGVPPTLGVAEDLACCQCGYNLRTLAHTGRCPECGLAVADSISQQGMRFRTEAEVRWVWRAIGLWVLAMLLPCLGYLAFYAATLCLAPYWHELSKPGSTLGLIYMLIGRAWAYEGNVNPALTAAAVVALAMALGRRRGTWEARLAYGAAVGAVIGAAGQVITSVSFQAQLPGIPVVNLPLSWAASFLLEAALVLCWLLLALQVHWRLRILRTVFWIGLLIPVLNTLAVVAYGVILVLGNLPEPQGGGIFRFPEPYPWQAALQVAIDSWQSWGNATRLILVIALGAYLRELKRVKDGTIKRSLAVQPTESTTSQQNPPNSANH